MRLVALWLVFLIVGAGAAPFKGDAGSWNGLPPIPAEATRTQERTSDVRCTVAPASGNVVRLWMSRGACTRWIAAAQALAKTGPKPSEIWGARVSACARDLARNNIQARSGEFYTYCARNTPIP